MTDTPIPDEAIEAVARRRCREDAQKRFETNGPMYLPCGAYATWQQYEDANWTDFIPDGDGDVVYAVRDAIVEARKEFDRIRFSIPRSMRPRATGPGGDWERSDLAQAKSAITAYLKWVREHE